MTEAHQNCIHFKTDKLLVNCVLHLWDSAGKTNVGKLFLTPSRVGRAYLVIAAILNANCNSMYSHEWLWIASCNSSLPSIVGAYYKYCSEYCGLTWIVFMLVAGVMKESLLNSKEISLFYANRQPIVLLAPMQIRFVMLPLEYTYFLICVFSVSWYKDLYKCLSVTLSESKLNVFA